MVALGDDQEVAWDKLGKWSEFGGAVGGLRNGPDTRRLTKPMETLRCRA